MLQIEQSQLSLEARFGDQLVVSINKTARAGLLAEEWVNGFPCFVDKESHEARSGDKCLVELKSRNPTGNLYYVKVQRVLEAGDGDSTLLKKVMERSRPTFIRCPYYVKVGLQCAFRHLKHRKLDLIWFHFRFIERLKLEQSNRRGVEVDYGLIVQSTVELIEQTFSHDSAEAVRYLVALAKRLPSGKCEHELALQVFERAIAIARLKANSKLAFVLENHSRFQAQ